MLLLRLAKAIGEVLALPDHRPTFQVTGEDVDSFIARRTINVANTEMRITFFFRR